MEITAQQNKLDRLIFGFIVIFIVSLTNSIFLNQIGYFGALLMVLIRWFKTKENKFTKTGLELPIILFLFTELMSALFSINQQQAFVIFFKRLVLIPIIFMIAAVTEDSKKAQLYFKIFIVASVITVIGYIAFAYRHYIYQLYSLESKGPSPFQYVMTAGGLMSFVVIILFAFLLNEKSNMKIKILTIIAFIISAFGLFSSYTRAAWLGAIAGMLVVLLISRKWKILVPVATGLIIFVLFFPKESKLYIFDINEKNDARKVVSTDGRASGFLINKNHIFLADYQNGISIYDSTGNFLQNYPTESPVTNILRWKENFVFAYLIDSRFVIGKIDENGLMNIINQSVTPGLTRNFQTVGENLYIADVDSGLSVYTNPLDLKTFYRFPEFQGISKLSIDSSYFAMYDYKKSILKIFSVNKLLPDVELDSAKIVTSTAYVWVHKGNLFFQTDKKLKQYEIRENKLLLTKEHNIVGVFKIEYCNSEIYLATVGGIIYKADFTLNRITEPKLFFEIGKRITDFSIMGNKLFITTLKLNRLNSILDPYHETNIERIHLWETGLRIFRDYPILGVGDIDLGKIFSEYKPKYFKENYGHLHNNYIHFLVILGLVGFVIVIFMLAKILLLNLKIYQALRNIPIASSFSLGVLAAFIGFLVSGLAEWNFGDQEIITMVWFTLGLNIAFYNVNIKNQKVE